jgi:hypothetical protein
MTEAPKPESRTDAGPRSQSARAIFMVRPAAFAWNPETAECNRFQSPGHGPAWSAHERAVVEFDALAAALSQAGVEVHVLDEPAVASSPDAVFPNNWVSLHHDGTVVLYPMLAPSRRRERRLEFLAELESRGGFAVSRLVDLTHHELEGRFLEGTGSVVFDHESRVAYACVSPRTDVAVLDELCEELGYEPFVFESTDADGVPVYHTNVVLSIGRRAAIVCAESVPELRRGAMLERLRAAGREVITIDRRQMSGFAGNVLEIEARDGTSVLAMSESARLSFEAASLEALQRAVDRVVAVPIPTIEQRGGGSVRCMLAEVFLPRAAG